MIEVMSPDDIINHLIFNHYDILIKNYKIKKKWNMHGWIFHNKIKIM